MENFLIQPKDQTALKGIYTFKKANIECFTQRDMVDAIARRRDSNDKLVEKLFSERGLSRFHKPEGGIHYAIKFLHSLNDFDAVATLKRHANDVIGLINKLNASCRLETQVYHNIIPTVGRTLLANNLTDATPTNDPLINKAELGTGTSTPANGDTTLQTGTYRNDVASLTNGNNIAYITAFFNATETSGTFREAGLYADGSGTVGNGVLVSRVSINVTKTTSQTLTIDWELTIS